MTIKLEDFQVTGFSKTACFKIFKLIFGFHLTRIGVHSPGVIIPYVGYPLALKSDIRWVASR